MRNAEVIYPNVRFATDMEGRSSRENTPGANLEAPKLEFTMGPHKINLAEAFSPDRKGWREGPLRFQTEYEPNRGERAVYALLRSLEDSYLRFDEYLRAAPRLVELTE